RLRVDSPLCRPAFGDTGGERQGGDAQTAGALRRGEFSAARFRNAAEKKERQLGRALNEDLKGRVPAEVPSARGSLVGLRLPRPYLFRALVAVGTGIGPCPPHRSRRAAFPHRAVRRPFVVSPLHTGRLLKSDQSLCALSPLFEG